MEITEVIKSTPLQPDMTLRTVPLKGATSLQPGKNVPVAATPLLREDRVNRGQMRLQIDAAEMVRTPMNAIGVTAMVHFVPYLAFERFENSLDRLNRSYKGEPDKAGGDLVPFINTVAYDRDAAFWKTLGIHAVQGAAVNDAYLEAYNTLWNYRAAARSKHITERTLQDTTLAPAFWRNPAVANIVPDFDQAAMDGEIELNLAQTQLPVSGIGGRSGSPGGGAETFKDSTGVSMTYDYQSDTGNTGLSGFGVRMDSGGFPQIFAELEGQGIKLSLANIELAKKTQAFAEMRKNYDGLDDDFIIDMLMAGIRVPDQQMAQPMLLDRKTAIFGYSKRYSTSTGSLEEHVTEGKTFLDLKFRTPPMNTGGIILVTLEIVPEQVFERMQDPLLAITNPSQFPDAMRDYLDPEKVDVVPNKYVDVLHSDPDGTFGYAPLNHIWQPKGVRVGGKFQRQIGDPFVEDRQRIWSVETVDPALTTDFYVVGELPNTIFADTVSDPFEVVTMGAANIAGLTQFGKGLSENSTDYEEILQDVDTGRIEQA
jgi:hypothetical protein